MQNLHYIMHKTDINMHTHKHTHLFIKYMLCNINDMKRYVKYHVYVVFNVLVTTYTYTTSI